MWELDDVENWDVVVVVGTFWAQYHFLVTANVSLKLFCTKD